MPMIVRRGSTIERAERSDSPFQTLLTRLAFGLMAGVAGGMGAWSLFGPIAGIIGAVVGIVVGVYQAAGESQSHYGSLLESILARLRLWLDSGRDGWIRRQVVIRPVDRDGDLRRQHRISRRAAPGRQNPQRYAASVVTPHDGARTGSAQGR